MSESATNTIKHTGIYGVGIVARNMASFLMLPIYTRYLTPEDYGVIELLSMVLDVVGILMGVRIGQAIFRYYARSNSLLERNRTISTALFLVLALNLLGMAVVMLTAQPVSRLILGDTAYAGALALFSVTLVLMALELVPLTFIRAQQRPWLFVSFSVGKLLVQISLNIYFVVYKHLGVDGVIYAAIGSSGLMAVLLTAYTFRHVGAEFCYKSARQLASFSIPLIFAALGSFYVTFGDRYFLRIFVGLEEVGIYSLGYKFGFLLAMVTWRPFQQVWDVQRYDVGKLSNANEIFGRTFVFISLAMITAALAIALFTKDFLKVMSAPEFWGAHEIVPIIVVAYLFQCWTNYCRYGLLLSEQTFQVAIGSGIAVVVITVGYLTLIPNYGGIGAAIATLTAFASRFFWENFQSKRAYDMELPWSRVRGILGLAAIIFLLSYLIPDRMVVSLTLRFLVFGIYIGALFVLPILSKEERVALVESIRNPLGLIASR